MNVGGLPRSGSTMAPWAIASAIRDHDWAATPLGAAVGWTPALRVACSMVDGSALPLAVAWGPERIVVANDAWLRLCDGDATPPSLGRPFSSTRLHAHPSVAQAFRSASAGTASCAQDVPAGSPRPFQAGAAHAFSPVLDEAGTVAGVLLAVTPLHDAAGDSVSPGFRAEPLLREVAALSLLHELSVELGGAAGLPESLRAVLAALVRLHDADGGILWLLDPQTGEPRAEAAMGFRQEHLAEVADAARQAGSWPSGRCMASRRRTVVHDMESDARFEDVRQLARDAGFRSVHATPILTRGGEMLGVLSVHFARPRRPSQGEMQIADMCARHAADAVEAARAREALGAIISELRRSEESLRSADRRKDEFLATLAHELRNPLAPIRTALQVLRLSTTDASQVRVQAMMERQVDHMVRLIEDLTEVSRITRGKVSLRRDHVDLATLVRGAIETSQPAIDSASHRLHVSLPAEPLVLHADAVRLVQVLANLVNNAARYTDDGGEIHVEAERDGDHAVVRVRDNGMGIAPESLGGVFELFTQGERAGRRTTGGLGIGLTIVRSLVALHGGTVEARSEGRGKGSEFVVRLPLATQAPAPHGKPAVAAVPAPAPATRVLVVDDNEDAAQTLAILLRMLGAEARLASCGETALRALDHFTPDLIILDLGLPGADGHEVARRIRARPDARRVTIAALTGWGTDHDRRASAEAGFDFHYVKPLEVNELHRLLSAAASARDEGGEAPRA